MFSGIGFYVCNKTTNLAQLLNLKLQSFEKMAAISTGLMIGGGLLTYAAAGLVRMMRRQAGLQQLYEAATTSAMANRKNTNDATAAEPESGQQTFTRSDKDGLVEFKWWSTKALDEKDPEIAIYRHNRAHGFYLKWNETRYSTPAYVGVGNGAMVPVGGGRPYAVERTRYSLFLARKEAAHNGVYTYNRYTNYRRTGAYSMAPISDTRITNVNVREVMKYLDSRCQDYYITAPTRTQGFIPINSAINAVSAVPANTNPSTTTSVVPSAGNDPAGNLYVFFDNELDIGQRVLEYDTASPNPKGKLDSRPIYFARFKAMRHFNAYNGYYARDINDIFWRYGLDARYPLTFISGLVGGVLTYWNW